MAEKCANYEVNAQMCPCANTDCGNWAICCRCVQAHRDSGSFTACMSSARPAATLVLRGSPRNCLTRGVNLEACACTWDPCGNRGICCECIRNHWSEDGAGRTACFR